MKCRSLLLALVVILTSLAPHNLAADFSNTSRLVSDNVRLNISGKYSNLGQIIGHQSINLNCGTLGGNGRIRAPKIVIKAHIFAFTGSINCTDTCTIIVNEPFDEKMFKRKGKGKFEIIVNTDDAPKTIYKSPQPKTLELTVE